MHIIWEVVIMSYSDALQGLAPKINIDQDKKLMAKDQLNYVNIKI